MFPCSKVLVAPSFHSGGDKVFYRAETPLCPRFTRAATRCFIGQKHHYALVSIWQRQGVLSGENTIMPSFHSGGDKVFYRAETPLCPRFTRAATRCFIGQKHHYALVSIWQRQGVLSGGNTIMPSFHSGGDKLFYRAETPLYPQK